MFWCTHVPQSATANDEPSMWAVRELGYESTSHLPRRPGGVGFWFSVFGMLFIATKHMRDQNKPIYCRWEREREKERERKKKRERERERERESKLLLGNTVGTKQGCQTRGLSLQMGYFQAVRRYMSIVIFSNLLYIWVLLAGLGAISGLDPKFSEPWREESLSGCGKLPNSVGISTDLWNSSPWYK